jgi:carbonic anhydrase
VKQVAVTWGYENNTSDWNAAFPLCTGKEQSPIDLSPSLVSNTSQDNLRNFMQYKAMDGRETFNNGAKSVQVNGRVGSLSLPDGQYDVKQVQFHFPSEHTVNGKLAAGELHIVHQKRGSTGVKDLAVVGILLEEKPDYSPMTPELEFMEQLGAAADLPGSVRGLDAFGMEKPLDLMLLRTSMLVASTTT